MSLQLDVGTLSRILPCGYLRILRHRHILHYSNLIVATNIQLIPYHGRILNKKLWKVRDSNHEAILDTIRVRVDPKKFP